MTRTILISLIALSAMFCGGCDNDDDVIVMDFAPAAPQGVFSITGDHAVYLFWNGPYENDIGSYIIWRSLEPTTNYREIGTRDAAANSNLDLLIYDYVDETAINGVTYYYAVSSVDKAGQVSELSAENVFDTPRPEGWVELFEFHVEPTLAGYNFSAQAVVSYTSEVADVFIDSVNSVFYINAGDLQTDLQDMGYTEDFDDIGWAPVDGWSANGWMELVEGHTYVIWTRDNHFAKIRVMSINSNSVTFEWAYQTDEANPELKPVVPTLAKPVHDEDYLIKNF
jgi:hypothetical protein